MCHKPQECAGNTVNMNTSTSPSRNAAPRTCHFHHSRKATPPLEGPQPLRILVVDDETSIREVLRWSLEREGHFVGEAADGVTGLERFRDGKWDIVLTDRAMPWMDGIALAREIRAIAPEIPILLVTGSGAAHEMEIATDVVDMVVMKPFRIAALHEAIRQVTVGQATRF